MRRQQYLINFSFPKRSSCSSQKTYIYTYTRRIRVYKRSYLFIYSFLYSIYSFFVNEYQLSQQSKKTPQTIGFPIISLLANMAKAPPLISFLLFSAAVLLTFPAAISSIGVNYGTLGNLPPPTQVANFLKTQTSIDSVKIFNVDPNILRAFAGTGISVVVTVPNGDIPALANGMQARRWVSANILPFHPQTKIKYISVGNEILLTGDNNTISKLLPAMRTINSALVRVGVRDVKVSLLSIFLFFFGK